ncbi:acyltransferase [Candidatus Pelagibacter sp.]|nr:acyltransferase [Candidatus Pelagibacter sp.]
MSKLIKYRPEIDGLRGIAVCLVVIFHARFLTENGFLFEGGMYGVDIFFVISGYLMTIIILNQINRDNYLSFNIFIESRIRRIWPAYFVLLLFCLYIYTNGVSESTIGIKPFFQSLFSSTIFQSNHFFPYRLIEYGAQTSLNMPLLHTWSLSVEIQFYVLFPILIFLIINFLKKNYFLTFFFLAILSIVAAELLTYRTPLYSFYFLPTRGFELMVGAMVAMIERNKNYNTTIQNLERDKGNFGKISNYCSFLGAILIIFTFVEFNEETRHPSIYTLVPVIGTALLILFSKDNFMKKFLSNKFFVSLGLISYSLYLFHYPIFAFPRSMQVLNETSIYLKLILILLSVIISIISYFLIEKIFRNKKIFKRNTIYIFTFFSCISLLGLSYYWNYNFKHSTLPKLISENRNISSWKDVRDGLGYCYSRIKIYCSFNWKDSDNKKLYVVGDSHMSTLESGILNYKNNYEDIPLKLITGRFYLPDFDKITVSNNEKEPDFTKGNEKAKRVLTIKNEEGGQAGNSIVIYGGYYSFYLNEDQFMSSGLNKKSNEFYQPSSTKNLINDPKERKELILRGLKRDIEAILDKHIMILIYPIPEAGSFVATELYNNYKLTALFTGQSFDNFINKNKFLISNPYQVYLDRNKEIIELFDNIKHPNLFKVYPAKYFCDNQVKDTCITHTDKEIYYHDNHHLSPKGAELVNESIIEILDKLYNK